MDQTEADLGESCALQRRLTGPTYGLQSWCGGEVDRPQFAVVLRAGGWTNFGVPDVPWCDSG